jgi:hypothetical protein
MNAERSRTFWVGLTWFALVLGTAGASQTSSPPLPLVVISQVYGAGGNSGALFRHDFIELFNRGETTVDLSGWAIHYASATGTTWQRTLLDGVLLPGQRYLVQQASGGGSGSSLPTPDGVGTIAMAASAGKVLLTSSPTLPGLTGGCPAGPTVVDLVGYGTTASCFEGGGRGPVPGSGSAVTRREGGCTDMDDNATDLFLQPPTPRNRTFPVAPCNAPTLPEVTAQAVPDPVLAGSVVVLIVSVVPGARPTSTQVTVTADLSPLGGPFDEPLLDDGKLGDAAAEDGRYSLRLTAPPGLIPGTRTLSIRVGDAQGRRVEISLPLTIAPPLPPSPLLISQIFAGGGNSGAPYRHDWVEIFHRGDLPVDLAGWSLQYAPATSGSWTATPLSGTLEPGRYYLIQLASSGPNGAPLPAPDALGAINLSTTGGKIALVSRSTPLVGTCPAGDGRVDLLGYGATVTCFEGERPAAAPQTTSSLVRLLGGCLDRDQNGSDWSVVPPRPRNQESPPEDCLELEQVSRRAISGQHPGSILLFPFYSSRSSHLAREDTRLSITNTSPVESVQLHLFWIDGGAASIADTLVCVTANQTMHLLASDLDPDISGFLLVVAIDRWSGCPIRFNMLIGEAVLKLETGHRANLAALSVPALEREPARCPPGASSTTLTFDGKLYQPLPTKLAASHLFAPSTGQETLLVVDRLGGSLATGMSTIGPLVGMVFDDVERPARFGLSIARRQLRTPVHDAFPRTTPRLSALLPPTRSGWMWIAHRDEGALAGVILVASSTGGMAGGRWLHTLQLAPAVQLVMPLLSGGGVGCGST